MDPSSFPKQYGGELDWEWGDMPNLDESARELVGSLEQIGPKGDGEISAEKSAKTEAERKKSFVRGPVAWLKDRIEIFGSIGGQPRRRTIVVEQKHEQVPGTTAEVNGAQEVPPPAVLTDGQANGIPPPA